MPGTIVLHTAHYIIRKFIVNIYMIKLSRRKFIIKSPVLAAIMSDTNATVISFNHEIGISGAYPPGMVIRMNTKIGKQGAEGFTTIFTHFHLIVNIIKTVLVFCIHPYILEIERTVGDPP